MTTATTMPTAEQLAAAIKAEILADVAAGTVPAGVASFSRLHDHVDANCYGNAEALCDDFGLDAVTPVLNDAQNAVDAWIKAGGIAKGA